MSTHPMYTDIVYPRPPRVRKQTTSEEMEERCRRFNPQPDSDILYDAADHIKDIAKQLAQVTRERDAADARVKILEAEKIALRALSTAKEAA